MSFEFSSIPNIIFWIELFILWILFPFIAYIYNKVISKEPKNEISNNLIIKQRNEMYELYFTPSYFIIKSLYLKELYNYMVYKITLFFNRRLTRYYYYYILLYIPIFPILFPQTFSKEMYLWGRYGSLYLLRRQIFNNFDSMIFYGLFMFIFWFPSIFYLLFLNSYKDIKELKSKLLKYSLIILKIFIFLLISAFILIVIILIGALFPYSLYSPLLLNAIYIILCMIFLR